MEILKGLIAVMAGLTVLLIVVAPLGEFALIRVVWAADALGNDIEYVEVYQYNGTAWNMVENFTVSGGSTRITDSWQTRFVVGVQLNDTLADDTAEARSYTRANMTIVDGGTVWNNESLNDTGTVQDIGSYYYVPYEGNWTSNLPAAGVTYNCTVNYEVYY